LFASRSSQTLVSAEIIPSWVDLEISGQRTAWNFADSFENGQGLFDLADKAMGLSDDHFVARSTLHRSRKVSRFVAAGTEFVFGKSTSCPALTFLSRAGTFFVG
jgi:hypothetical protein